MKRKKLSVYDEIYVIAAQLEANKKTFIENEWMGCAEIDEELRNTAMFDGEYDKPVYNRFRSVEED